MIFEDSLVMNTCFSLSLSDDELPDYIMVMVANKKTFSQMTDDLGLFLGSNTTKFTTWSVAFSPKYLGVYFFTFQHLCFAWWQTFSCIAHSSSGPLATPPRKLATKRKHRLLKVKQNRYSTYDRVQQLFSCCDT